MILTQSHGGYVVHLGPRQNFHMPRTPSTVPANSLTELTRRAAHAEQAGQIANPETRAPARERGETIAQAKIRFSSQPGRNDPRADHREAIEVQKRFRRIKNDLIDFQAAYREAKADGKSLPGTARVEEKLSKFYDALDLDIGDSQWLNEDGIPDQSATAYRKHAQKKNDELKGFKQDFKDLGYSPDDDDARSKLNAKCQQAFRYLTKARIRQAQRLLEEKPIPNPILTSNAALTVLSHGDLALDKLKREIQIEKERSLGKAKTQEMQTLNALGKTIWAVDLEKLGMKANEEGGTDITQRVWIRPHAYVTKILDDIKANDIDSAEERLEDLTKLYTSERGLLLTNSILIKDILGRIGKALKLEGEARLDTLGKEIKAMQAHVTPARQAHPIFKTISFGKENQDSGAALRSRIYVLQGNVEDFKRVSQQITYLTHIAGDQVNRDDTVYDSLGLLDIAAKEGGLSKEDKDNIEADLKQILNWTNKGNVDEKQIAEVDLEPTIQLLDRAYKLQKKNKSSAVIIYRQIANQLRKVIQLLRKRLSSLVRISRGTERKFNSLFIDFKDNDIQARAIEISRLFEEGNYDEVLEQVQEIRERYFAYLNPEPGYRRISKTLAQIEDLTRDTDQRGYAGKRPERIRYLSDLINLDIEKKNRLRLTVYDLDAELVAPKFCFPHPNLKEGSLLKWIGKTGTESHIGYKGQNQADYRSLARAGKEELVDESLYFISSTKPSGRTKAIQQGDAPIPINQE